MMKIRVEQALFGYDKGHRLLASSRILASDTQRHLRKLTDAAFEGSATTFFTVQPLTTEGTQAFIRTWRADDWNRPGSVWSHVLLVGHSDLSKMTGFGAIARAFRRPSPVDGFLPRTEVVAYQTAMEIPADEPIRVSNVNLSELCALVHAVYSTDEPISYRVGHVNQFESVLLALTEQQWPRLRRNFSCRTRQRPTQSAFDVELVERPSKSASTPSLFVGYGSHGSGQWAERLANDLIEPDENFRRFLRVGGTESHSGRSDLHTLVDLYDRIARPAPDAITAAIAVRRAFPSPSSQTLLKTLLFGKAGVERFVDWPIDEASRLSAALAASPALNLKEIEFGARLARLALTPDGSELVTQMDLEALPLEAIEPVVVEVAGAVDLDAAVALAHALPELGALIVARRPELLGRPEVWTSVDAGLLLEILEAQSCETITSVLEALLVENAVEALAMITSANPAQWWELLGQVGTRMSSDLVRGSATLRSVLSRVGSAALGTPPAGGLAMSGAVVALALSADLNVGLWRRVTTNAWINLLPELDHGSLPRFVVERIFSVALTSSLQSKSSKVRTDGWQRSFGFLHEALQDAHFDDEGWQLLANVLPAGPEWDRCSRLRRGAAWEARRDEWPSSSLAALVDSSRPFQDDMRELISSRTPKSKKNDWLRSILRLLE